MPTTSPGLPLVMAAAQLAVGHWGAFLITPLAGAVTVFVTFLIGRAVRSTRTGLIAAWLLATSPPLLFMLMWPMTDVPAAATAALAALGLLQRGRRAAVLAGLACAFGILLRPNFVLIATAAFAWLSIVDRRRAVLFAIAALPGVMLTLALNAVWHGSPVRSGYGADALFSIAWIGTNAARYGAWMLHTAPAALIGTGALVWPGLWSARDDRRQVAMLFGAIAAATVSAYLVYEPWPYWWYLRFLLPAWPVLFVAAAALLDAVAARSVPASALVLVVVLAAGFGGVITARARDVFRVGAAEHRYAAVARLVEASTEPDAVILTTHHSGTLRNYAGRETLRYDLIAPDWLDRAVAWLAQRGRRVYVLLEDSERASFEARFAAASTLGRLDVPPVAAWQSRTVRGWVFLFDPVRRDAVTAQPGAEIDRRTPRIPPPAAQWTAWR